jgi:hypothetical protein
LSTTKAVYCKKYYKTIPSTLPTLPTMPKDSEKISTMATTPKQDIIIILKILG